MVKKTRGEMKFGLQNDSTNAYQMGWCAVGAGEEREERQTQRPAAGAGKRGRSGGQRGKRGGGASA